MYSALDSGVWVREGADFDFAYSDGDEVEARLLSVLRQAADLGSMSEELQDGVTDWPSEYHLSRQRHVLLRPLSLLPGQRVLELGAGCGALTRFLGESGVLVDAVEGSLRRAQIAQERTRDLANVRVYCDDLMSFESKYTYDWVILVGVLEYAPVFIQTSDPIQSCLQRSVEHLAPNGNLVVGIENRIGLKYLNGANEDHLSIPLVGIENRYGERQPRTLTRESLLTCLHEVGMSDTSLFLPFPDYKLPSVILSDTVFGTQVSPRNLLASARSYDYSGGRKTLFNESLVRTSIADEQVLANLADSFLFVASQGGVRHRTLGPLAWHFSIGKRRTAFACETVLEVPRDNEEESIVVTKQRLNGSSAPCDTGHHAIQHRLTASAFTAGETLSLRLLDGLARAEAASVPALLQAFIDKYVEVVNVLIEADSPKVRQGGSGYAPGRYFDCLPKNIIISKGPGELATFIDDEWVADDVIPLSRVFYRAAVDIESIVHTAWPEIDMSTCIRDAFVKHGLNEQAWDEYKVAEYQFQIAVNLQQLDSAEIYASADSLFGEVQRLSDALERDPLTEVSRKKLDRLTSLVGDLTVERDAAILNRDRLAEERDSAAAERDWWFVQFHQVRSRRAVRAVLYLAGWVQMPLSWKRIWKCKSARPDKK